MRIGLVIAGAKRVCFDDYATKSVSAKGTTLLKSKNVVGGKFFIVVKNIEQYCWVKISPESGVVQHYNHIFYHQQCMLLPQYCCIISTTYISCRVVLENRHVPNLNHFGTLFPLFAPAFSRLSFTCCAGADVVWSVCSAWLVWTLFGLSAESVSISCVDEYDDDLANRSIRYLLVNKIEVHYKITVLMSVVLIWVSGPFLRDWLERHQPPNKQCNLKLYKHVLCGNNVFTLLPRI